MVNIKWAGCLLLVLAAAQAEAHGGCGGFGSVLTSGAEAADSSLLGLAAADCSAKDADQVRGLFSVTREQSMPSSVRTELDTHYYALSTTSSMPGALQDAGHVSERYEAFWHHDNKHDDGGSGDEKSGKHGHWSEWQRWCDWKTPHETTPVPLPATVWLTLSALIGLGMLRNRRAVAIQM